MGMLRLRSRHLHKMSSLSFGIVFLDLSTLPQSSKPSFALQVCKSLGRPYCIVAEMSEDGRQDNDNESSVYYFHLGLFVSR